MPGLTRALALLTVVVVTFSGVGCAGDGSHDAPEPKTEPSTTRPQAQKSPEHGPPRKDRIAFAIELDGTWLLATANADGSGDLTILRRFNDVPSGDTSWSPDGEMIATVDLEFLWVINADGTAFRAVIPSLPEAGVAWSPDGRRLAFPDSAGIYVEDVDGANRRLLARCDCEHDTQVAWSPDGGTIAYSTPHQIHLVHPDGTGRRALTRAGAGSESPDLSWSPDGKRIAFTRAPLPYVMGSDGGERVNPDKPDLFVIDIDGSGERELGSGENPTWAPAGARIAFTRRGVVHTISSDGRNELKLGRGDLQLSWSPSGTQIAVRRDFGRKRAIWVWNIDGSGGRQIWPRRGACKCSSPAWQPR